MDTKTTSKASESQFASKWGFILSAVGSAVGMANVWGFSYRVGMYGGGAFIIVYLIFIVLFSYVGLPSEYGIGRRAKTGTVGAYKLAWVSGGKGKGITKHLGWLPLAGSLCIAIGYAVIIAYVIRAFTDTMTGTLMNVPDTGVWFESFSMTEFSVVPFHIITVVGTLLTLLLGADSIEKSNKVMMPIFFLIFVILAIRVAFLPGSVEGYKFLFSPQWSQLLDPMVWVWAMAQALFSLSLTGSGMIVYGAYLGDKEDIFHAAKYTAIFDTVAAMVASLVIIPACFAYDMDVAGGPGLLFVTLPKILQDIPMGGLFAAILYAAMIFAGVSSLQNMFEAVGESVMHNFPKINRNMVLIGLGVVCFGVGLFMNPIYKWGPWMDLVSIYIIPIGAALGAFSWYWIMKKEDIIEEVNKGCAKQHGNTWHSIGKFVYVPLVFILCLIALFLQIAF